MRTILTNDYHGTECRSNKSPEQLRDVVERIGSGTGNATDRALVRKIHNALCGSDTCTCGDNLGCRPSIWSSAYDYQGEV